MNCPIGLSTGMFVGSPIAGILETIKQAGFDGIEIAAFRQHFNYHSPREVEMVKGELDRLGLRAVSLHAPYSIELDITSPSETQRRQAVSETTAAAGALARLGGRTLVIHAGSEDEKASGSTQRLRHSAESLTEIYEFCRKHNLKMAIEDMLGHLLGGRTWEIEWVLSQLPTEGIGVCLDTGHSYLSGDLQGRLKAFAPRLMMLHVHDNAGRYDDHLPPGEGRIDWPWLFRSLAATGFKGDLVLEIAGGQDPLRLIDRTRRSVAFLKDLMARL
ncbi:MAG: sugar phosphate isomerase/epimerase [Chloroflexi bacterium]|nr:sugar phosphate isomerase/epimerase [Chloroflexota bacterium]